MTRRRARVWRPAIALTAAALIASGCGGDEGPQIPRENARALGNLLREARDRYEAGPACGSLRNETLPALDQQVAALPARIDRDVRTSVEDGVAHLRELIESECDERDRERRRRERDETTEEETTPPPPSVPTEPPETTDETQTREDEETEPPDDGGPPEPTEPPLPDGGGTPGPGGGGGGGAPAPGEKPGRGRGR